MYFVSMSGECDVWVDEKGCVKRLERERGEVKRVVGCGDEKIMIIKIL